MYVCVCMTCRDGCRETNESETNEREKKKNYKEKKREKYRER